MIGVSLDELLILKDIFSPYQTDSRFACYGSRVKGGFEKTSDLDILICGKTVMPSEMLEEIKQKRDDSRLPYMVDFCDFHKIDPGFYKPIEKDLIFLGDGKNQNFFPVYPRNI